MNIKGEKLPNGMTFVRPQDLRALHRAPGMGRIEAAVNAYVDETACGDCNGTGRDPMSDTLDWLRCMSCGGSGYRRAV